LACRAARSLLQSPIGVASRQHLPTPTTPTEQLHYPGTSLLPGVSRRRADPPTGPYKPAERRAPPGADEEDPKSSSCDRTRTSVDQANPVVGRGQGAAHRE